MTKNSGGAYITSESLLSNTVGFQYPKTKFITAEDTLLAFHFFFMWFANRCSVWLVTVYRPGVGEGGEEELEGVGGVGPGPGGQQGVEGGQGGGRPGLRRQQHLGLC